MIEQQTLSTLRAEKGYYTTRELAELYHCTPTTICNWLRKGWLQGDKMSDKRDDAKRDTRHWRIWPQQIEEQELRRDELIELSKRYWPMLLARMKG